MGNGFSSPFGGIIIKSVTVNDVCELIKFSSPFGGIIIKSERSESMGKKYIVLVPFRGNHYQIGGEENEEIYHSVLVPFRGNHYQISDWMQNYNSDDYVLVPFRGNHYQILGRRKLRGYRQRFSSPFGGIIIKSHKQTTNRPTDRRSRPLSGESLSNLFILTSYNFPSCVLVPFRGNHYQIPCTPTQPPSTRRSRPLSGESLSNRTEVVLEDNED